MTAAVVLLLREKNFKSKVYRLICSKVTFCLKSLTSLK